MQAATTETRRWGHPGTEGDGEKKHPKMPPLMAATLPLVRHLETSWLTWPAVSRKPGNLVLLEVLDDHGPSCHRCTASRGGPWGPGHYELPHCKTSPPKTAVSFGCINTCYFAIIDLMWVGIWSNMITGEPRWSNVVQNCPKLSKMVQDWGRVSFGTFFVS